MTVYDVTLFNGEIDMLLVRLRELALYVDVFVVCESSETFSAHPKALELLPVLSRLQAAAAPAHVLPFYVSRLDNASPWMREAHQRDYPREYLLAVMKEQDRAILADLDEVPDFRVDAVARSLSDPIEHPVKIEMDLFYYHLDCLFDESWRRAVVVDRAQLQQASPQALRADYGSFACVRGGWHMSYFSHQEYNTDHHRDPAFIRACIDSGTSLFTTAIARRFVGALPATYDLMPPHMKKPCDRRAP